MEDFSLLVTIGLIFMITLIGAYLRSRRKDRCLNAWQGFHITLERASGKLIWGVLKLEPTGWSLPTWTAFRTKNTSNLPICCTPVSTATSRLFTAIRIGFLNGANNDAQKISNAPFTLAPCAGWAVSRVTS